MLVAEPFGETRVAIFDRPNHGGVLGGKQIRARLLRLRAKLEVEMKHAHAFIEKPRIERGEIGIPSGLGDGQMEGAVGLDHRHHVTTLACFLKGAPGRMDVGKIVVAAQGSGQAAGHPLHQIEGFQVFWHRIQIEGRNHGASIGQDVDQPLAGETDLRLANRRAGETETFRQANFVQGRPRAKPEAQDILAHRLVDLCRPAAPATPRGACRLGTSIGEAHRGYVHSHFQRLLVSARAECGGILAWMVCRHNVYLLSCLVLHTITDIIRRGQASLAKPNQAGQGIAWGRIRAMIDRVEPRASGDVTIIGAGIVGICCACYLQRAGFTVTIFDRLGPGEATSFGNSGGFATGEIVPLATPGLIRELPGWLMDPLGPLALRWSYLPRAVPWLLRFLRAGAGPRVRQIAIALAAITRAGPADYAPLLTESGLSDIVARNDCLYDYDDQAQFAAESFKWALRREHGISFETLAGPALHELEPNLGPGITFGVRMHGWYHVVDPFRVVTGLAAHFRRQGGKIERAEVVAVEQADGRARRLGLGDGRAVDVERLVIAAGAWSSGLVRQLGSRVPLESHRGYHVTIPDAPIKPRHPEL